MKVAVTAIMAFLAVAAQAAPAATPRRDVSYLAKIKFEGADDKAFYYVDVPATGRNVTISEYSCTRCCEYDRLSGARPDPLCVLIVPVASQSFERLPHCRRYRRWLHVLWHRWKRDLCGWRLPARCRAATDAGRRQLPHPRLRVEASRSPERPKVLSKDDVVVQI